ncbi:MAG TPA: ribose 5-phosphate isomerase B [Solirubrobacteraceae bacterium]|nr:ribose 5-phosphate isomerase B [Solirubrobacteraceae bacterium]
MRIVVGADHAGYELKQHVAAALRAAGHDVGDVGTDSPEQADYPLYAEPAARMVAAGDAERGVLVCGSGVGVSIVANKVAGVRAVNAHDVAEATTARRHNGVNVLALAGRRLSEDDADAIVAAFLETPFEGGRHQRRVDEIADVERRAGG